MSADEDGGDDGSDDGAEDRARRRAPGVAHRRRRSPARRLSAHDTRGERLARAWTMPSRVRPVRRLLDPADWRTGFLRVEGEREIPQELQTDLHENAPQALLRDLYRPVRAEAWVEREIVEGTGDRGGRAAMQEVARGAPAAGAAARRAGRARRGRLSGAGGAALRRRALAPRCRDEPRRTQSADSARRIANGQAAGARRSRRDARPASGAAAR